MIVQDTKANEKAEETRVYCRRRDQDSRKNHIFLFKYLQAHRESRCCTSPKSLSKGSVMKVLMGPAGNL